MSRARLCIFLLLISNLLLSRGIATEVHAGQDVCDKGLEQCVAEKRQEWADRGTLGAMLHPLKEDDAATAHGARWIVHQVIPGGAAAEAGLLKGDLLSEWNGEAIPSIGLAFVDRRLESLKIGDKVRWTIWRAGESKVLHLAAKTPERMAIEYWLLFYVHENYSEEEFKKYEEQTKERFTSQ